MLVTDRRRTRARDMAAAVAEAVAGGVGIVQVREKDLPPEALASLVRRIVERVPPETRVIVNTHASVAMETGCGLHLPADAPWSGAAHTVLIGRSMHHPDEAWVAAGESLAYVIAGNIYTTESKPGKPAAGVDLISASVPRLGPVPLYAIGGITIPRVPDVVHAGAYGVAVCGAILGARDPRRVAQGFALALAVAKTPGRERN
ncbi:hypothetical protein ABI59_03685 [Acidobacteria bacterium Mor1]|nr:hypothetical protein ABI59_03685 [Acidobacteria bacterium Mor1]